MHFSGPIQNFSGTTDAGDKEAAPQMQERHLVICVNNSDTQIDFSLGGAADSGVGSAPIAPGKSCSFFGVVPTNAIHIGCASAGKAYTLWIL